MIDGERSKSGDGQRGSSNVRGETKRTTSAAGDDNGGDDEENHPQFCYYYHQHRYVSSGARDCTGEIGAKGGHWSQDTSGSVTVKCPLVVVAFVVDPLTQFERVRVVRKRRKNNSMAVDGGGGRDAKNEGSAAYFHHRITQMRRAKVGDSSGGEEEGEEGGCMGYGGDIKNKPSNESSDCVVVETVETISLIEARLRETLGLSAALINEAYHRRRHHQSSFCSSSSSPPQPSSQTAASDSLVSITLKVHNLSFPIPPPPPSSSSSSTPAAPLAKEKRAEEHIFNDDSASLTSFADIVLFVYSAASPASLFLLRERALPRVSHLARAVRVLCAAGVDGIPRKMVPALHHHHASLLHSSPLTNIVKEKGRLLSNDNGQQQGKGIHRHGKGGDVGEEEEDTNAEGRALPTSITTSNKGEGGVGGVSANIVVGDLPFSDFSNEDSSKVLQKPTNSVTRTDPRQLFSVPPPLPPPTPAMPLPFTSSRRIHHLTYGQWCEAFNRQVLTAPARQGVSERLGQRWRQRLLRLHIDQHQQHQQHREHHNDDDGGVPTCVASAASAPLPPQPSSFNSSSSSPSASVAAAITSALLEGVSDALVREFCSWHLPLYETIFRRERGGGGGGAGGGSAGGGRGGDENADNGSVVSSPFLLSKFSRHMRSFQSGARPSPYTNNCGDGGVNHQVGVGDATTTAATRLSQQEQHASPSSSPLSSLLPQPTSPISSPSSPPSPPILVPRITRLLWLLLLSRGVEASVLVDVCEALNHADENENDEDDDDDDEEDNNVATIEENEKKNVAKKASRSEHSGVAGIDDGSEVKVKESMTTTMPPPSLFSTIAKEGVLLCQMLSFSDEPPAAVQASFYLRVSHFVVPSSSSLLSSLSLSSSLSSPSLFTLPLPSFDHQWSVLRREGEKHLFARRFLPHWREERALLLNGGEEGGGRSGEERNSATAAAAIIHVYGNRASGAVQIGRKPLEKAAADAGVLATIEGSTAIDQSRDKLARRGREGEGERRQQYLSAAASLAKDEKNAALKALGKIDAEKRNLQHQIEVIRSRIRNAHERAAEKKQLLEEKAAINQKKLTLVAENVAEVTSHNLLIAGHEETLHTLQLETERHRQREQGIEALLSTKTGLSKEYIALWENNLKLRRSAEEKACIVRRLLGWDPDLEEEEEEVNEKGDGEKDENDIHLVTVSPNAPKEVAESSNALSVVNNQGKRRKRVQKQQTSPPATCTACELRWKKLYPHHFVVDFNRVGRRWDKGTFCCRFISFYEKTKKASTSSLVTASSSPIAFSTEGEGVFSMTEEEAFLFYEYGIAVDRSKIRTAVPGGAEGQNDDNNHNASPNDLCGAISSPISSSSPQEHQKQSEQHESPLSPSPANQNKTTRLLLQDVSTDPIAPSLADLESLYDQLEAKKEAILSRCEAQWAAMETLLSERMRREAMGGPLALLLPLLPPPPPIDTDTVTSLHRSTSSHSFSSLFNAPPAGLVSDNCAAEENHHDDVDEKGDSAMMCGDIDGSIDGDSEVRRAFASTVGPASRSLATTLRSFALLLGGLGGRAADSDQSFYNSAVFANISDADADGPTLSSVEAFRFVQVNTLLDSLHTRLSSTYLAIAPDGSREKDAADEHTTAASGQEGGRRRILNVVDNPRDGDWCGAAEARNGVTRNTVGGNHNNTKTTTTFNGDTGLLPFVVDLDDVSDGGAFRNFGNEGAAAGVRRTDAFCPAADDGQALLLSETIARALLTAAYYRSFMAMVTHNLDSLTLSKDASSSSVSISTDSRSFSPSFFQRGEEMLRLVVRRAEALGN